MRLFNGLSIFDNQVIFNAYSSEGEQRYAVEVGKRISFSVIAPSSIAISNIEILFYKHQSDDLVHHLLLRWTSIHAGKDTFSSVLNSVPLKAGLYELLVKIHTPEGIFFLEMSDGHIGWLTNCRPSQRTKTFLVYNRIYPSCDWVEGGVIYHIFVDRFYRGDETPISKDAILNSDWENGIPQYPKYPGAPLKNNMFFGGNLSGIIEKLPYLASLGVSCLYLSPIFEAASNHKYDVGNYMKIDASFGDEQTLGKLIALAHKLDIRIILDGVFNHTGADSIYFNKYNNYSETGAYQSKDSPYYDWYYFKKFPEEYECWWGIGILPKLNLQNPQVREYILSENGVIAHYAKMGIDGFRLDVADELDDDFISKIKNRLSTFGDRSILYGEVWEDASCKIAYGKLKHYFWGDQLDGVMNYPMRTGLIRFVRYGEVADLYYALETVMRNAPKAVADAQMNFLGTHDTERIIYALADVCFDGMSNDEIANFRLTENQRSVAKERFKLALICLATLPGVTTLYYGDEVGMEGYKDPFNRMPYPWHKIDVDLQNYVKQLFFMRRENSVYKRGVFKIHRLQHDEFVFSRMEGDYAYVTVVNRGDKCLCFDMDILGDMLFPQHKKRQNFQILPMTGAVIKVNKKANCYLYTVSQKEIIDMQ